MRRWTFHPQWVGWSVVLTGGLLFAQGGPLREPLPLLQQSPLLKPLLKRVDPGSRLMMASRKAAPLKVLDRRGMEALKVTPVGGVTLSVGQVFDQAMASHCGIAQGLVRIPASARVGEPEVTEAVVEFPDRYVLVRQVRTWVKDAVRAAEASPAFADLVRGVDRGRIASMKVSDLEPDFQASFRAFLKGEFQELSPDDPLKQAMAQGGEDAVLRAYLVGEGELEVVDEIEILREPIGDLKPFLPKISSPLTLSVRGPVNVPEPTFEGPAGRLESSTPSMRGSSRPAPLGASGTTNGRYPAGERALGEARFEAPFLAGFTLGHWQGWSRKWSFGRLGWVRLSLNVGVGLGLRIPLKIKGQVRPSGWERSAPDCPAHTVRYELEAEPFDAPASFYRQVGLPETLNFGGNEFVFQSGATFGFKVVALGKTLKEGEIEGPGITRSHDFQPPLAQHRDLFTFWVPAELTNTKVDYGVFKAFVEVGLGIGGRGAVDGAVVPLVDHRSLEERRAVQFTGASERGTFEVPGFTPGLPWSVQQRTYGLGFRFGGYRLTAEATLKLRAGFEVDASAFHRRITTDPLDLYTLRLMSFLLPPHAGTEVIHRWDQGRLVYETRPSETSGTASPKKP